MSHSDISEDDKIPKSSFAVYRTEADSLFRSGKYGKAIKCYTQALEQEPTHEHCLVARSRCYLHEGQIEKALADAETSLTNNNKNPKGLFQKAEVLYFQGEFEKSLVLYHRGHKLRPEMEAFRLGIQKSEEAINNSVGDPETIKLRLDCDLSYFFLNDDKQNDKIIKKKQVQDKEKKLERKPCNTDSKTVKQLLGELYADREFLEKLLKEEESLLTKTENSEQIRDLVVRGLNYLDDRSDFWQQQKPMYARKKRVWAKESPGSTKQQRDIIKYVVSSLDEIDLKQSRSEHKKAIKQSEDLIKQINKWSDNDLQNKTDILANLYCLIGNSYLEMGDYEKALEYHVKDKDFGNCYDIEEAKSRSIDNIGRVHAKRGEFQKAIETWQEKVSLSKSPLESTWLHHEMGRCYLELGDNDKAIEYGEKSIDFAREAEDDTWQMNASILVAQAATKSKKYSLAIEHFERAHDYSKIMKNNDAEDAIKRALEEVNQRIIDEEKISSETKTKDESQVEESKDEKTESERTETKETTRTETQEEEKTIETKTEETHRESPHTDDEQTNTKRSEERKASVLVEEKHETEEKEEITEATETTETVREEREEREEIKESEETKEVKVEETTETQAEIKSEEPVEIADE